MVERLTRDLGIARIAIFYQDDAFGRAGFAGVQRALQKRGIDVAFDGLGETLHRVGGGGAKAADSTGSHAPQPLACGVRRAGPVRRRPAGAGRRGH